MSVEAERLARVALSRLVEPGHLPTARLVAELGAVEVYDALLTRTRLPQLHDLGPRLAEVEPGRDLEHAHRLGIRFVMPGDDEWPSGLDDLALAEPLHGRGGVPLGLWVRGPGRLDAWSRSLAIVGARSATTYGVQVAGDLAAGLAREGRGVVSGAAFGIDLAAHRGALGGGGATLAVLACGVDRVYPEAHRALLEHLAASQLVVSEAPVGAAPMRVRFLARNRLIAALTAGTVVVEAAVRSGALNTANWAGRLNRLLMGVPGPVSSAASQGVHQLIRAGGAQLVTDVADVLELVGSAGAHLQAPARGADRPRDLVTTAQAQLLDAVPIRGSDSVLGLARAAGLAEDTVVVELERLETLGLLERRDDRWHLTPAALV